MSFRTWTAACLVGGVWLGWTEVAEACGGTFCDAGPNAMPVDQASETIVFVQDGPYVEAHIQIAIDPSTDAQKFAWLVPMPAAPEFAVGSQPMFDAMLAATSPRFSSSGDGCGFDETAAFIQSPDAGGASRDPEIHVDVVGAFEVTTLEGGTVDSVMAWLGDNGYAQDPIAEPVLAEYLAAGHVLVAFKLVPDAAIAEVHPVVLRFLGDEPCVPIKLTAIAATDDMAVRAFFLGEGRYAPTNYRHVELNPLRVRWDGQGASYVDAVTLAVDEAPGGHGFVTEYAGASDIVTTDGVFSDTWDAAPFVDAAPTEVVDLLNAQGIAECTQRGPCLVFHPLVVAMLRKYLPAPPDVGENAFYACIECYADMADFGLWDGAAFSAEYQERIVAPGAHAAELLATWPYLTRMFTTMSSQEMNLDPTFHVNAELAEVPLRERALRECVECSDGILETAEIYTLPDGRRVETDGSWPSFPSEMPWAERIEQIPAVGAPIVEVDNRALIDELLAQWNEAAGCADPGDDFSESSGNASGGFTTGSPGGGSNASGDGGEGTSGGSGDAGADGDGYAPASRGCTCSHEGTDERGAWWLGAVVVLAAARRRRGAR